MRVVSIIIPTHGRPTKLRQCLAAIERQRLPGDTRIETIVAVDGAENGEFENLNKPVAPFEVRFVMLPRVGVSAARNAAMQAARGDLFLFINDDCYAQENWVAAHIAGQAATPRGELIVGRTDWMAWPDMTVFDGLLRDTSMIFFYDRMTDGERYGFRHFWTCNASAPATMARAVGGFNESLYPVFYDDVEFAFRVERATGLSVRYVEAARNVHDHRLSFDDYLARERRLGEMAVRLFEANRDCFAEVFGVPDAASLARMRREQLTRGGRPQCDDVASLRAKFSERFVVDSSWPQRCREFYEAHLPLKRQAFYEGLATGIVASPCDFDGSRNQTRSARSTSQRRRSPVSPASPAS